MARTKPTPYIVSGPRPTLEQTRKAFGISKREWKRLVAIAEAIAETPARKPRKPPQYRCARGHVVRPARAFCPKCSTSVRRIPEKARR